MGGGTFRGLAAILLLGCAVAFGDAEADRAPVAWVHGRPITKAEFSDWVFERHPETWARTLDGIVDDRLAHHAAERDGITVPAKALERGVAAEIEARRAQLREAYGPEADLEAEVRRVYGTDVATWRREVLAPRVHAHLRLERVVRWDRRRRDALHARVIVLHEAAQARRLVERLRAGADFSLVAAQESADPSARRGGDLPWMSRGDLAFPGVEERLFGAPAGALLGPLEVQVDGRPQWQVYKVIERESPWAGAYTEHAARLEEDLAAQPVDGAEYERWRVRARREAGVRTLAPVGARGRLR